MTTTTRVFSLGGWTVAAALGLLCLPITRRIPESLVVSGASLTQISSDEFPSERAPFVISGIDAFGGVDVRLVVSEGQSENSRVERSVILYSSDGGTTWERQLVTNASADYGTTLEEVRFVSSSVGWAAGYNGIIMRTTDAGRSWLRQPSPTKAILTKIQFVDDDWGWILAEEGGEILHTEDGGVNWRTYNFSATGRMSSFSFSDRFNGWIVGENGQAFETKDAGKHWAPRGREVCAKVNSSAQSEIVFRQVRFVSRDVGFIAAGFNYKWPEYRPNGVILKTTNGGRTWQRIIASRTLGLRYADFASNDNIWIVQGDYRDERLLHSADGGRHWFFVHAASKAGIVKFVDRNNGWLIAGLWDYPITDQLLRTTDGGLTWSQVELPK